MVRRLGRCARTSPFQAFQLRSQRRRALIVAGRGDRLGEQVPRGGGLSLREQIVAFLQHRLGAPLPFGHRASRPIDVRPRTRMRSVEEQHTGPEVHCLFEAAREIVLQPLDQQRLDATVATARIARRLVVTSRFSHVQVPGIIATSALQYKG